MAKDPGWNGITVRRIGNTVTVRCPYNPSWNQAVLPYNAYWTGRSWGFDAQYETAARNLLCKIYGHEGRPVPTLSVDFDPTGWGSGELWFAGLRIAWRPGYDRPVVLGEHVLLPFGGFSATGGTPEAARLDALPGTRLEVARVPTTHPDMYRFTSRISRLTDDQVRARRLNEERDTLAQRIEAIDAELKDLQV